MSIKRLLKPQRLVGRSPKPWRQIITMLGLACILAGVLFLILLSPAAIAKPAESQPQPSKVDHLTQTCFQLLQQANYQPMVTTCTKAVEQARASGDRASETYALINLASAYGVLGQYSKAIGQAKQALHLAQELSDRQAETYALINLGHAYQAVGQPTEAIAQSEQALQLLRQMSATNGPGQVLRQSEIYALINLASAHWSLGQYARVIDFSEQSLQLTHELGEAYGTSKALRQGEACSLINLASAHGALENYPQAMQYAEQALHLAQTMGNRRGEVLALNNLGYALFGDGQLNAAEAHLRQSIDLFESLRPALQDTEKLALFETLTNPYHTLQRVLVAQGKPTEALEIAERGRARALVDRLAQRSGATTAAPISLAGIQQVAREQRATLVEYALAAADQLYIWVVSPTGTVTFRPVDLSPLQTPLAQLVSASRPGSPEADTIADSWRQLYDMLMAPIQDLLPTDPADHVVVVPQGSLFLVPFSALQAPDQSYLIKHHTLRMTPSIQVLQLTHPQQRRLAFQRTQKERTQKKALVVGNPTDDLPAAAQEAKTVARRFNTRPLLGQHATKAEVIRQMPQASLIHLATHAAPNQSDETYGGVIVFADPVQGFSNLTADEILDMQLQAELVVLSGCSTGVSDVINSDGVVGLARSLMTAGAPSILMSLWPVADAPTAGLMQQFYQNWRPTIPHRASGLGLFAPLGLVGVGVFIVRRFRRWGYSRGVRQFRFMTLACVTGMIVLAIGLSLSPHSTPPTLDKAQALRQAMLSTLATHPDPQDWAAFTLLGEA